MTPLLHQIRVFGESGKTGQAAGAAVRSHRDKVAAFPTDTRAHLEPHGNFTMHDAGTVLPGNFIDEGKRYACH
jgi:3D (Asp-Asp-Asp) domain-containing protein